MLCLHILHSIVQFIYRHVYFHLRVPPCPPPPLSHSLCNFYLRQQRGQRVKGAREGGREREIVLSDWKKSTVAGRRNYRMHDNRSTDPHLAQTMAPDEGTRAGSSVIIE